MRAKDCPGAKKWEGASSEVLVSVIPSLSLTLSAWSWWWALQNFQSGQKQDTCVLDYFHIGGRDFTSTRDKKDTHITQRFFWWQREDTPIVYIRDNTRVPPSFNNDVMLCCLWIAVLFCAAKEEEIFNKKWEQNDSPTTLKWQQNNHPIQISSISCCLWTAFLEAFRINFVLLKDWRFG